MTKGLQLITEIRNRRGAEPSVVLMRKSWHVFPPQASGDMCTQAKIPRMRNSGRRSEDLPLTCRLLWSLTMYVRWHWRVASLACCAASSI